MTFRRCILVLIAAAFVAGCGGSGADPSDPRAVARAYYMAGFSCGEQGIGVQYDLSTSPARDWSRAEYLRFQRRHGCRPTKPPPAQVQLLDRRADFALVDVIAAQPARLVLVHIDGQWKVDTSRSVSQ